MLVELDQDVQGATCVQGLVEETASHRGCAGPSNKVIPWSGSDCLSVSASCIKPSNTPVYTSIRHLPRNTPVYTSIRHLPLTIYSVNLKSKLLKSFFRKYLCKFKTTNCYNCKLSQPPNCLFHLSEVALGTNEHWRQLYTTA